MNEFLDLSFALLKIILPLFLREALRTIPDPDGLKSRPPSENPGA